MSKYSLKRIDKAYVTPQQTIMKEKKGKKGPSYY